MAAHRNKTDTTMLGDALFVSEQLSGRVVVPDYRRGGNTVVLMHRRGASGQARVRYGLTDEGDLRLCLPAGEVVLRGVRDPDEVNMVMRAH